MNLNKRFVFFVLSISLISLFLLILFGFNLTGKVIDPADPLASTCVDSDGNNLFLKGIVTYTFSQSIGGSEPQPVQEEVEDFCSSNILTEYTCALPNSPNATATNYTCEFGCSRGKCNVCSDSDPLDGNGTNYSNFNGINIFVRDSVFGEKCVSGSNSVEEYYCVNSSSKGVSYKDCGNNKCYDGACRSCIDYDSVNLIGPTHNTSNFTWNYTNPLGLQEYCDVNGSLVEYYCSGSNILKQIVNCSSSYGSSYSCYQGACKCQSNLIITNLDSPCGYDEKVVRNWVDLNGCIAPYSAIEYCDYDSNGLIYDPDNSGIDNVIIGGVNFDPEENYTGSGIQTVRLKEKDNYVEFRWDFSKPLNIHQTEVKVSSSSLYNYVIVENLNVSNKTIFLDRSNNSTGVCIRDEENVTYSDFSSNCSKSGEILISCPGKSNNSKYSCEISSGYFKVWPLSHSGIKEMFSGNAISCVSNWSCGTWSNSTGECGTRNCIDLNDCSNNKVETKTCGSCNPDWDCPDWDSIECIDGEKERTCVDSNNCGSSYGKPSESLNCSKNNFGTKIDPLFLVAIILGVGLVLFIIFYFLVKRKRNMPNTFNVKADSDIYYPNPSK